MQASNFSGIVWHPLVIFAAMFFIVESFFGWEAASFLAEEIEDAPRVIPKALLWASATVVLLGIALAVVSFGNFGAQALTTLTNPVLTLGTGLSSNLSVLIIIGVFLTFLGGVVGAVVSSPRLLLALSRDKLFVEQCGHIHPVHKTPSNAIIFQTIVTILAVIVAFGEYNLLLSLLVPLALIMYAAVLLSVPVLRAKLPKHERPFRVWGGSWLPVFVAALYVCVIVAWYTTTPGAANIALVIGGFLLLAFPIYLFLTIVYNPDAIISLSNGSARINYFLEDFLFPRKVRREVLDLFKGHLRGKEIVEFGSGVGTFTMHLAEEVGPQGSVVAIDLSRMNLDILERRLRERGHSHVRVLHDEHQVNRLHPDIHQADMIYSVGFLGYVQDLHKILHEMHAILAPGGKICFVEYTNFFQILPDPAIVSDHARLQRIFAEAGFSVSITKRNGFLWDYLIIHGIKTDGKVPFV